MAKELRLAFAMGGGVSLGTFSGAALSEALKLAILRGIDESGEQYDRVVIDVLSGASAGSMALCLMLRALLHQTDDQREKAEKRLIEQLGSELDRLSSDRRRDLIAAQVVQDLQEEVWIKDIGIERLLGKPPGRRRSLRHDGGLLNRHAVEEIAAARLTLPTDPAELGERYILADRVLFASTLSSIGPMLADARAEYPGSEVGYVGLVDGLTSRFHRDVRVFDLSFEPINIDDPFEESSRPHRWFRMHAGKEVPGKVADLRRQRSWAKIAATSVACGAFPFVFAPVVLMRKRFELGPFWPAQLDELIRDPAKPEYPFTYIDGGTFNNEPIREAFRLASFVDAQRPEDSYDRRVIFVDPSSGSTSLSFRVPIHQQYFLEKPNLLGTFDGYSVRRRSTLDRLLAHLGSVARAILNEARVVEADKVFVVHKRFELRSKIRELLNEALSSEPQAKTLKALWELCSSTLRDRHGKVIVPAAALTLDRELRRVIAEEKLPEHLVDGAVSFAATGACEEDAELWLRAIAYVAVDLIMNLEGKQDRSSIVAIAPVRDPDSDEPEPILLPGGAIFGFAGFLSEEAGRYEVEVARYCARRFMEACSVIRGGSGSELRQWRGAARARFDDDVERKLPWLAERLEEAVRDSHLLNWLPGVDKAALALVASQVKKLVKSLELEQSQITTYELRVRVPSKRFELDGKGVGDRDLGPIRTGENGSLMLVTFAEFDQKEDRWQGVHVAGQALAIHRDGWGPLPDRRFCTIELPGAPLRAQADLLPYPVFVTTIDDGSEGERLPASVWEAPRPGVVPLEETIFTS